MSKERWAIVCFWLALAAMMIVGRYTYQDYGITVDEDVERKTAFVNYQYAYERITGKTIRQFDIDLDTYHDRYYGAALQLPMVAVEHMTGFTMPIRDAFLVRHLYTFLLCTLGWICLYHFIRIVFRSRWPALLGMLMCALYPRFWGEQFTNIKDMVFAATCCAGLLGVALCLENEGKWRYEFFAAFVGAVCANTRFIGFQFPGLLFGYRILRDFLLDGRAKTNLKPWFARVLPRYLAHIALLLTFYFLITPASWEKPFAYLMGVFQTFSNYTQWGGMVPFLGTMYRGSQLPWSYLITWVLISVPLWNIALMVLGGCTAGATLLRQLKKKQRSVWLLDEHRYALLCAVVAAIPLLTPLFKEVTLYDSWRHAYYVFPMLVVLAVFGFRWLWRRFCKKGVTRLMAVGVLLCLFAGQIGWTVNNHPYEKVYFNPLGRRVAEAVDRDHWYESAYNLLQVVLENDDTSRITLASDGMIGITVFDFLPEEQARRFYVYYNGPDQVDYYVDGANTPQPERFDGYTPVYELRMKDGLVLSTLHIRNEVLQERFSGLYPNANIN